MSELAVREEQPELTGLMKWAAEAQQVARIAESIAKTSFVPRAFANKPAEVTAAILAGAEVGLGPMASLRAIHVIQGTPAMSALAMRGVVQAAGHEVWVEEAGVDKVIVSGRRAGSTQVQTSTWTESRARRMGLTGKDNWKLQPQAMLTARATAEVCRLIASDALIGLGYAVEELEDPAETVTKKATTRKRAELPPLEPDLEPPAIEAAPVLEGDTEEGWPETAAAGGEPS